MINYVAVVMLVAYIVVTHSADLVAKYCIILLHNYSTRYIILCSHCFHEIFHILEVKCNS